MTPTSPATSSATAPFAASDLGADLSGLAGRAYLGLDAEGKLTEPWAVREWIAERVREAGPNGVAWLLARLQDAQRAEERMWAIEVMAALGEGSTIPAIVEALRIDPDPRVRRSAAWALSYLCAAGTGPALLQAFEEDPDMGVRDRAAFALYSVGERSAIPVLGRAFLEERDAGLRRTISRALSNLVDGSARTFLEQGRRDADPWVRLESLRGLAFFEDATALEEMTREFDEPPAELENDERRRLEFREEVLWALRDVAHPASAPFLRRVLETERHAKFLEAAIWILQYLQDRDALPSLDRVIETTADPRIRSLAERVRRELAELPGEP